MASTARGVVPRACTIRCCVGRPLPRGKGWAFIVLAGQAFYHRDTAELLRDALLLRRSLRRRLDQGLYDAVMSRLCAHAAETPVSLGY